MRTVLKCRIRVSVQCDTINRLGVKLACLVLLSVQALPHPPLCYQL